MRNVYEAKLSILNVAKCLAICLLLLSLMALLPAATSYAQDSMPQDRLLVVPVPEDGSEATCDEVNCAPMGEADGERRIGFTMDTAGGTGEGQESVEPPVVIDNPISLGDSNWVMCATIDCQEPEGKASLYRTLTFVEDAQVRGLSGCNQFFGQYKMDSNHLRFGTIGTTRLHCGDEVMAQERAFLDALQNVDNYQIHADSLTLYTSDGTPLASFLVEIQVPARSLNFLYLPYIETE